MDSFSDSQTNGESKTEVEQAKYQRIRTTR